MTLINRDLSFFLIALISYEVFLMKGVIYYYEAIGLLSLTGLYIVAVVITNRWQRREESAGNDQARIPISSDDEEETVELI